jgi:hypothetical protein
MMEARRGEGWVLELVYGMKICSSMGTVVVLGMEVIPVVQFAHYELT